MWKIQSITVMRQWIEGDRTMSATCATGENPLRITHDRQGTLINNFHYKLLGVKSEKCVWRGRSLLAIPTASSDTQSGVNKNWIPQRIGSWQVFQTNACKKTLTKKLLCTCPPPSSTYLLSTCLWIAELSLHLYKAAAPKLNLYRWLLRPIGPQIPSRWAMLSLEQVRKSGLENTEPVST